MEIDCVCKTMNSNFFLFKTALAFAVFFAMLGCMKCSRHFDFFEKYDFHDYDHDYDYDDEMDEDEVVHRYPGLFKTEEEIANFYPHVLKPDSKEVTRRVWETLSSATWNVVSVKQSLSFTASLVDISGTLYHGCCATNRTWADYNSMTDKKNKTVQIVQYPKRKQYFEVDSCVEVPSCDVNCTCQKENRFYSALIYNPNYPKKGEKKFKLDLVQGKTICRCINNHPPGSPKPMKDEF